MNLINQATKVELQYGQWYIDQKIHCLKRISNSSIWPDKQNYHALCGKESSWMVTGMSLQQICLVCYKHAKKKQIPIVEYGTFSFAGEYIKVLRVKGVNYRVDNNLQLVATGNLAKESYIDNGLLG